jgi:hypothetical protein
MKTNICDLKKVEVNIVAGGSGVFDGFVSVFSNNRGDCMGDGRNQPVNCYDANGNNARGWMAYNWDCAKWFCCSGDKGGYSHIVMGKEYENCITGRHRTLDVSNPDNLNGLI